MKDFCFLASYYERYVVDLGHKLNLWRVLRIIGKSPILFSQCMAYFLIVCSANLTYNDWQSSVHLLRTRNKDLGSWIYNWRCPLRYLLQHSIMVMEVAGTLASISFLLEVAPQIWLNRKYSFRINKQLWNYEYSHFFM